MKNKICIIGQGYVGSVMSIACSLNKNFAVFGIERKNKVGNEICRKMNSGIFPFHCTDKFLLKKFNKIHKQKNFTATTNIDKIKDAEIIIVSIGLNILKNSSKELKNFKKLFKDIAVRMKTNTLLIIECTLPTGFTQNIIMPILKLNLEKRNLALGDIAVAYSYERIMPGKNYLDSLINAQRVYAGLNKRSESSCKKFFSKIINTKKYPLQKLNSIEECETAKLLENSYRAVNIAFIEDWVKFSKIAKLNIQDIINVIKVRSSHSNLMKPGLGVGGYCLTKDPLFLNYSLKNFYKSKIEFKFNNEAVKINKEMPHTSADLIKSEIKKNFFNKKIKLLLAGITYREDVADTRNSPTETLFKILKKENLSIEFTDPFFEDFKINNIKLKSQSIKKGIKHFDILVFCVAHTEYKKISFKNLGGYKNQKIIIDLNNCISTKQINQIKLNKHLKFTKLGSFNE